MKAAPLFSLAILLWSASQILIKIGLIKLANTPFGYRFFVQAFTSVYVLLGLFLSGLGVFCWLMILSRYDLAFSNLLVCLTYVLIMIFSFFFLHEPFSLPKIIGAGLIIAGVFFVLKG
ncbi:MAG: EamA family transporter [Candidatus Aminicenantes bacterium]|nr:EamA family transporter [Candidatus Aminicenantes bacterium]